MFSGFYWKPGKCVGLHVKIISTPCVLCAYASIPRIWKHFMFTISCWLIQYFVLISALQLSVSHDGDQCPGTSDQCAVILPFDKHLELTCTSDSSSKLEWFVY